MLEYFFFLIIYLLVDCNVAASLVLNDKKSSKTCYHVMEESHKSENEFRETEPGSVREESFFRRIHSFLIRREPKIIRSS